MVETRVEVKLRLFSKEAIERRFKGREMQEFLERIGVEMGKQMAVNVVKHGGRGGGEFPQLSGYNQNKSQKARIRRLNKTISEGGPDAARARHELAQAMARQSQIRQRGENAKNPHSGYALRKSLGKTPGRGRFGPGDRLRDTGALQDSYGGEVNMDRLTVTAIASGQEPDRPTNQQLLEWHATGAGNLPVRNPTEHMELFEQRVAKWLRDFLSKPFEPQVIDIQPS